MRTDLFDYDLPERLIAKWPSARREDARLLVVERGRVRHQHITDWPDLLAPGSLVVLNDTRVIKARLEGIRPRTGGKVEILLLRQVDADSAGADAPVQMWTALGRANRPLREGSVVEAGPLLLKVMGSQPDGVLTVEVRAEAGVRQALEAHGHVPIPPYLRRRDEPCDHDRYQTVYAEREGSVAAPTAGFHLTEDLIDRLGRRHVRLARLTLHIGLGTFRPVTTRDLDQHEMHAEWFEVGPGLVAEVEATRAQGAPVVAVGTTVVRALESAADPVQPGLVVASSAETRLLIQPGYRFSVVDAMLTNFHLPRSTLLALVAAFVGRERMLDAYRAAVDREYRFLSYGDAMWLPERIS